MPISFFLPKNPNKSCLEVSYRKKRTRENFTNVLTGPGKQRHVYNVCHASIRTAGQVPAAQGQSGLLLAYRQTAGEAEAGRFLH